MSGGLEVLDGGILTTVQDSGRFGYQQFGMGTAGVMDPHAYKVGNLLVGNEENAACLEATLLGPKLLFRQDLLVAVTGANMSPRLDGSPAPLWQSFPVKAGSVLEFGKLENGCRSYICVAGGIQVPMVMGSRSTYLRGSVGGFEGRKIKKGDLLPLKPFSTPAAGAAFKRLRKEAVPEYSKETTIRLLPGPQDDYFLEDSLETLFSSPYKVTRNADRMGYRLEGPVLKHKISADIISDGIPPGAVQVPGHGNPIIMLADRQTTGGYPKIAAVITADLHKVAQLKPGDEIYFQRATLEEGYKALKDYEDSFAKNIEEFKPETGREESKLKIEEKREPLHRERVADTHQQASAKRALVSRSHKLVVTVQGKPYEVLVEELEP